MRFVFGTAAAAAELPAFLRSSPGIARAGGRCWPQCRPEAREREAWATSGVVQVGNVLVRFGWWSRIQGSLTIGAWLTSLAPGGIGRPTSPTSSVRELSTRNQWNIATTSGDSTTTVDRPAIAAPTSLTVYIAPATWTFVLVIRLPAARHVVGWCRTSSAADVHDPSRANCKPQARESVFPTRQALGQMKSKLKGAQTGHDLLKRKSEALTKCAQSP